MLTIKECRELLEDDAKELSDEQIIEVREWLSMMADIIIEQVESDYLKSNTHENGNKKENTLGKACFLGKRNKLCQQSSRIELDFGWTIHRFAGRAIQ